MYMTTLTALIAVLTILALIMSRPDARTGNDRQIQSCQATQCFDQQPASRPEQLPRLSRNRWERQDIARVLMADDDYAGRITPPSLHAKPPGMN